MASAPCATDAFIAIAAQFKLDRRSLGFLQRLRRKKWTKLTSGPANLG